jgi:hypothetical protein
MDVLLQRGMAYTEELGLSWPQDREVTEEQVRSLFVQLLEHRRMLEGPLRKGFLRYQKGVYKRTLPDAP